MTVPSGTAQPGRGRAASSVVLDCPVCCAVAGPHPPAAAEQLAGSHDDQAHRGEPTTDLRPTLTLIR